MTDRELMQQALEALEAVMYGPNEEGLDYADNAIEALRERLAQPEQEPVAWIDAFGNVFPLGAQRGPKHLNEPMKPLYTVLPQRKPWQGLTDEDKAKLDEQYGDDTLAHLDAIEAKLREKNHV